VLEPGQERVLTFEIPWPDPILWDLENPFLYWFTTEIAAGGELLDRRSVRFGFREFWIEGPHFLLNGHKVRLMGESGVWPKWDPRPGEDTPRPGRPWSRHDRPGVEALYRAYKAMNMTAVRLHYRVGNRVEIEVADELGLLVIPQSGLWTAANPMSGEAPSFSATWKRSLKSGSGAIVTAPPWSFGMWKTRSCAGERPCEGLGRCAWRRWSSGTTAPG